MIDLDAIEARWKATTDGPWERCSHGTWEVQAPPNQRVADFGTIDRAKADAAFAAHAHQDIPALVAEVRRLRDGAREAALAKANELVPEVYLKVDNSHLYHEWGKMRAALASTIPSRLTLPDGSTAEIVDVRVRRTLRTGGSWHESMSVASWRGLTGDQKAVAIGVRGG